MKTRCKIKLKPMKNIKNRERVWDFTKKENKKYIINRITLYIGTRKLANLIKGERKWNVASVMVCPFL